MGQDGEHGEHVLLAAPLYVFQQLVEAAVDLAGGAVGLYAVAEAGGDGGQVGELLGVGVVVDAVDEALGAAPLGDLADVLGHRQVGQEHELLHELVGVLGLLEVHAYWFPVPVDFKTDLGAVEFDGARLVALLAELLGQAVEHEDLAGVVASARLDDLLRLLVGEAAVGADDGGHDAAVEHSGVGVHGEDGREGELLLAGAQGADAVAEVLGKHGDCAVHQVDAGGALAGLLLDDGLVPDVVSDVGDVDAYLPAALAGGADAQGVVEVLGVPGVDGEGGHGAEVLALCHLLGGDAGVDVAGGLLHGLGVFVRQAELGQDGVHLGVVLALPAEDVEDLSYGVHLVLRPGGDSGDGLVARLAAAQAVAGYDDVGGQELGVGHQGGVVALHLEGADEVLVVALDDLDDARLGLGSTAGGGDFHADAVAVEGVHGVALGHQDALVVDRHGVAAVAAAREDALLGGASVGGGLVLAQGHFLDLLGGHQVVQEVYDVVAGRGVGGAYAVGYLLVVERAAGVGPEEVHDGPGHLALAEAAGRRDGRLLLIIVFHSMVVFINVTPWRVFFLLQGRTGVRPKTCGVGGRTLVRPYIL